MTATGTTTAAAALLLLAVTSGDAFMLTPRMVSATRTLPARLAMSTETETVTYVQCSKCKAAYVIDAATLGKGKKVTCSVCQHGWWQSVDRLNTLSNGFKMEEFPEDMMTQIKANLEAGREATQGPPKQKGELSLFVGNLPFSVDEETIEGMFARFGGIASVSVVKTPDGRSRGFCFVEFEKASEGQAAIDALNGEEVEGRAIIVQKSDSK